MIFKCIFDVLICSAAQLQECLINLLTYLLTYTRNENDDSLPESVSYEASHHGLPYYRCAPDYKRHISLCTIHTYHIAPLYLLQYLQFTLSNNTSSCSDSLNLTPLAVPAPLYLWTLWRYTNKIIIIIVNFH